MPIIVKVEIDKEQFKELSTFEQYLIKTVDDLSKKLSEILPMAGTMRSGDIGIGPSGLLKGIITFLLGFFGEDALREAMRIVRESIPKSPEENLDDLKERVQDLIDTATEAKLIVEGSGEIPNSITKGDLPRDLEFIQERIDSLKELLLKINSLQDEFKSDALKSADSPISFGVIIQKREEQMEAVKKIQEELNAILEPGNEKIKERSQLLPLLENAYASLDGPTSDLILGQGLMSDAFIGSTLSAVKLAKEGINPLTGKASELGISIEDLFQNTSEGAVIFGFTKEELLGLRDATDEAAKSTEYLGENGFTAVKENVEQAGNKLGTLDANLMNVADRNKDVVDSQDQVNQVVGESGVVYDDASKSVENYGDTVEQVQNQGGFFDGIKQGFIDFVESVESNSELMADFFANTLSQMSQSFSDLFFNVITGRFDDLKDLAKQAFEAILRAFLDLVSAIATRQIVISIGGLFGIGKGAQAAGGGGGSPTDIAQQGAGVVGSGLGLFGSGGAFATLGAGLGIGGATVAPIATTGVGALSLGGQASIFSASLPSAFTGPGFLATAGAAITVVGAVLAAAALAFTIIAPFLEKTPRLDIDFDSVKTEAGRRAALISELLDDDFLKDEIIDISVKRKAGLGLGGDEGIKDVLADAIQVAVNNLLDIINKLPTDLADTLSEELLNTPLDTETEVAGERLFEFDAKGKKIAEKFNQLINGEIQAKFLFAVDGFLQTMFESLGVLPEAAEAFLDERFEEFKNAGSREARAAVGQELLADINAFVDAFNIVSGNVNDSIGQTIRNEEMEYRLAA